MTYKYTTQEFDQIKSLYQNGQSLEDIQSLFPDKSVASIRMKLVKAGLYKKSDPKSLPVSATKAEPKPTTKSGIKAAFKAALDAVGEAPF